MKKKKEIEVQAISIFSEFDNLNYILTIYLNYFISIIYIVFGSHCYKYEPSIHNIFELDKIDFVMKQNASMSIHWFIWR